MKKRLSDLTDVVQGEVVLDAGRLEELITDFETTLLEGDVAFEVCELLKERLKESLQDKRVKRAELKDIMKNSLKDGILEIFPPKSDNLLALIRGKPQKPYIIAFVGINGTGKTTTIAKIAHLLVKNNMVPVLAASDTFRAGAIEQLEEHAKRLDVRMIKHDKGADPAAVAFDAIEHAKAAGKDAVLIDTAGRMETNTNLIEELKKVVRVTKPDMVIFVGDALTGNAALDQAETFSSAVPIDGTILTKADADAKGGSAISIAYATKKPIMFLGTGQEYKDLIEFDPVWFTNEILN
ncbi:signal recognition particle-docking protein FtsY [archaeon]|nr:signal recognition particle-docking protein FtsY [archaeon]